MTKNGSTIVVDTCSRDAVVGVLVGPCVGNSVGGCVVCSMLSTLGFATTGSMVLTFALEKAAMPSVR